MSSWNSNEKDQSAESNQLPPLSTTSTTTGLSNNTNSNSNSTTLPPISNVGPSDKQPFQQQTMLPPPSAINNSQSHGFHLPGLPNMGLSRYGGLSNNSQHTQLPSLNSISQNGPTPDHSHITLPPANQLLNKTSPHDGGNSPDHHLNSSGGQPTSNLNDAKKSNSPASENTVNNSTATPAAVATIPASASSHVVATPPAATATTEEQNNPNYKPLNVKDALYYLDQVKLQFRSQTDVYNNFLDIMKDFKSQNIDTPGVIERVSSLFKGHPRLIDGFNTFLPQGFSIECSTSDPNTIVVTTPMGTSIRKDSAVSSPKQQSDLNNQADNTADQTIQEQTLPSINPPSVTFQPPSVQQDEQKSQAASNPVDYQFNNSGAADPSVNSIAPAVAPQDGYSYQQQQQQHQQQTDSKQSTPAEFDQAINYVNKIKQRYAAQPDIYKLFLENLQMYQKGLKPINEVYKEISVLFRDAPDLLEDFKLFMPDNTVIKDVQQQAYPSYPSQYYAPNQLPPVGNFQSAQFPNGPPPADIQNQMLNQQYALPQQALQPQQQQIVTENTDPYYSQQFQQQYQQYPDQTPKGKKKGSISSVSQTQAIQRNGNLQPSEEFPVSNLRGSSYVEKPALISGVLEPVYPKTLDTDLTNELSFFDKVKKAIGNKQTYNEFLKLLRLYSSDVIKKSTLYEKSRSILGGFPELLEWFKDFIGYEESPLRMEDVAIKKQQIDLMMCKAAGPSYRQLPKSQTKMPCSGRDDLCWSVFNDEWVGHPVWASEESGFIAHRKNQYEEMLFRIEDERHEYDYFMEANLRTIQSLETIANRMANMTPEEKAKFKLPVGLGHTSSTIYIKVIRKIYDKDRGWEVIDSLHENPVVTVPIVLKRLKQKDEEWKRAHREWNKVWREAEQKLMIKSLDHLGLSFKNIDKKLLTNKQLVSEISTIKQEQANKKLHPLMTGPKSELVTQYQDFSVFFDILKLVNVNLKHNQMYSTNDKDRMENFMRTFLVKFFFLDQAYVDEELIKRGILREDKNNDNLEENTSDDNSENKISTPTLSQTKKRPRDYDLLKDVLRKNKRKRNNDQQQQHQSLQLSEAEIQEDKHNEELQKDEVSWISNETISSALGDERDEFNMFANTQIYVFYRHLDTLYKRLMEIKKISEEANQEIKSRVPTKFASDLGLIDHHLEDLGIDIKGNESYNEALELCVKLIDNRVEQNAFEESLRIGFRNKAFKLFTIDRVIQSLMKHCHTIVSDSKCTEILLLMEKDHNQPKTSTKDQILYRIQVRSFMSQDENMFKITYNKSLKSTTITFLALEDLTIKDSSDSKEANWNYYLTSYSMSHPTEGIEASKIRLPFLKNQLENEQNEESEVEGVANSKLGIKIDKDTYRLNFEPESYDLYIRNSLYNRKPVSQKNRDLRVNKLIDVINGEYGISGDLKDDEVKNANERFELLAEKGADEYLKFDSSQPVEVKVKQPLEESDVAKLEPATATATAIDANEKVGDSVNEEANLTDKTQQNVDQEVSGVADAAVEPISAESAIIESGATDGDSTIQQDETVEKVDA